MLKIIRYITVLVPMLILTGNCYSATTSDIDALQEELAYYKQVEADQEIYSESRADEINAAFISSGIFMTIEQAGEDIRIMKDAVVTSAIQLEILLKWKSEKDGKDRNQDVAIQLNRNDIDRFSTQKELSEAERRGTLKSIISSVFTAVLAWVSFKYRALWWFKKTKRNLNQNEEKILK